ncbi:unnamed protein product [Burkholderia pseudomallei]|nr:unnamed protein product [Burkholderia pseudomallei]
MPGHAPRRRNAHGRAQLKALRRRQRHRFGDASAVLLARVSRHWHCFAFA